MGKEGGELTSMWGVSDDRRREELDGRRNSNTYVRCLYLSRAHYNLPAIPY